MRKITEQASKALRNSYNFKSGNTKVFNNCLFLHDNKIAKLSEGNLIISLCGWDTNTTKERLNGVLSTFNLGYIFTKNFITYLTTENGNIELDSYARYDAKTGEKVGL